MKKTHQPSAALLAADLCLVSCVSEKLRCAAPAKELYTSSWFRKVRSCVEAQGWPWLILSAKYGLVSPEEVIAPYEKTLNNMLKPDRREWAEHCMRALGPHLVGVRSVVFFAGKKYREFLAPELSSRGIQVCVPMAAMRIGEQLAWLNRCVA